MDTYTSNFVQKYHTVQLLLSVSAKNELRLIALLADVDIAKIESRHASVRRLCHTRSTQTHAISFCDMSAEWLCQQQRVARKQSWFMQGDAARSSEAGAEQWFGAVGAARVQEDARASDEGQAAGPSRRRRGRRRKERPGNSGGPWRAFCHVMLRRRAAEGRPSLKELGRLYRALTPEEKNHYRELGHIARLAAKVGGSAFGITDADARAQVAREALAMVASDTTLGALAALPTGLTLEEVLKTEMKK